LAQIVESALDVVRGAAEAKSIQLEFKMPGSVGPVMGDNARLQQVIWNVLSNAVKFTPKGGKILVQLLRVNSQAVIKVADTGEGIGPEYLPALFQRFSQSDTGTRRRHGGLGIGLSIAKQLIELHGGKIAGDSAGLGKGATFTIALPLSIIPVTADQYPMGELSHSRNALKDIRVLVVDDEEYARDFLVVALSQFGATVHAENSVRGAIGVLDEFKPHVVITDIGMPEEDGYDLIRQMRLSGKKVPAVALTAFARSEDRDRALAAGFQVHLPKPVGLTELVRIVASLATTSLN
jgi:CheY-like chemotaxis protein